MAFLFGCPRTYQYEKRLSLRCHFCRLVHNETMAAQDRADVWRFTVSSVITLPAWALFLILCASCGKVPVPPAKPSANKPISPELATPHVTLTVDSRKSWHKIDDPDADGWDSEVLAQRAKARLDQLGRLFFQEGDVSDLLAVDFRCDPLVPEELSLAFEDRIAKVEHGQASDVQRGDGSDLERFFTSMRAQDAGRFEFKVTKITPSSTRSQTYEETPFTTEQYLSLSFKTAEAIVEHHAKWIVGWRQDAGVAKLADIRVAEFARSTTKSPRPLFSDCTESAIAANACYGQQLAYGLNHWLSRLPVRAMLNRFGTPGVAVGDVDGDGRDDLYLCQEPGLPNRLFLQNPDGTVHDVSAKWGVDWIEDSRAAILVDFDNDGDQDLAVAIYGNIVIARNRGQADSDGVRFEVVNALPTSGSTASLAAADYDSDGLLDLFVCAYVQEDVGASIGAATERFVYHDAENGAPNSLFHNEGKFEFTDVTRAVEIDQNNSRWSFAASWEDFDDDGDPDLYVANDYGRNNLYRNDAGPAPGSRRFVDVAAAAGVEDSASGMSVTWGDYDRDGHMDVYVSNMFSAAGSRVTAQEEFKANASDELRGRYRRFARGNSLFRNLDATFEDVSLAAHVNLGRWAWGSSFADINNDSWQDLIVANGYLSSSEDDGDL